MKKKELVLVTVMLVMITLFGAACGNTSDADATGVYTPLIGMESGLCDGAGDITWDMDYDQIAAMKGAVISENTITFNEISFGDCTGQLNCSFDKTSLTALTYVLEGDKSYEDYVRIRESLISAYGEPDDSVTVEEAEKELGSWPMDCWMNGVTTSGGQEIKVLLESKLKKGWVVVTMLKK